MTRPQRHPPAALRHRAATRRSHPDPAARRCMAPSGVRAAALCSVRRGRIRVPAVTTFVGRTSELDMLEESLDAVGRGEARAVEIVGPAGIGKTRLLAELAQRADARAQIVL